MLSITRDYIKNLFTSTIYNRGFTYYREGLVDNLTYDKEDNSWYAKVIGSDIYDVEINLTDKSIQYDCDCPAHFQYGSCKHIVATLLKISEQMKTPEHDQNKVVNMNKHREVSRSTTKLIQLFSSLKDLPEDNHQSIRTPLKIEYACKIQPKSWDSDLLLIEMKVGEDRLYVVKNMKEFLTHVDQQEEYVFTPKFSYDPQEHYFEEEDYAVIQLLLNISKSETFYNNRERWTTAPSTNQRALNVPPMFADQLFSMLSERNCLFDGGDVTYNEIQWIKDSPPFSFVLDKDENGFKLDLDLFQHVTYLDRYGYIISRNSFYKLTKQQQLVMDEMVEVIDMQQDQYLPIDKTQIHSFVSHVLPGLKKIGHLKVADKVSSDIINPPLLTKIFLNQEEERLVAKLEYHYDDIIISPFHNHGVENHSKQILMRSVDEENQVMRIVEQADFKFNGNTLFMEDEDALFRFYYDILPQLEDKAEIYMSNHVKASMLEERQYPKVKVNLEPSGSLLEVNFDFEDIDGEEISNIIQSIVEKKRYYRLPNGTFVPLEEDEFTPIGRLFGELDLSSNDFHNGQLKLPAYRSLQVDELLSNQHGSKYNKAFRQLIEEIKNPINNEYPLPDSLHADLREYQHTGFQWLKALSYYRFGGILADDMGLGKTLQAIAFLLSELEENQTSSKPALVIAPASLVYNWKSEFEKFAPDMKVKVVYGARGDREEVLENLTTVDVIVTSYPLIRQDIEWYQAIAFSTLILDEAQAIKNHATKTAKAVKSLQADRRFALSGTPIENSLDELWSIFDGILPGFFPSKKSFSQLKQEQISRMSRPFILRRVKKEVLKELPDKIETVHTSELTLDQKQLYLGYLEKIQGEAAEALATDSFQKSRMKILAGLTRLRQLCCHPSLFIENYQGESGKLNQLFDTVENAIENGQRILIFSQFSSMLKIINEQMKAAGTYAFYLDGQTPSKERVEMAERFNNGEKEIFLISLKAGGTGLNLTGADTVILYDLWWNPAVEEQAAGRAHRMGQKKVVQVIRMITQGTIEEKIFAMQQKKKELIENVIQPGETMLSTLSEGEIRELLSL